MLSAGTYGASEEYHTTGIANIANVLIRLQWTSKSALASYSLWSHWKGAGACVSFASMTGLGVP